jgi:CBS-domain-containing membrane protein
LREDATLDELEILFERHPFHAVPVVDAHHELVGVVGRDSVAEAIANRADAEEYTK